MGVVYLAYCGSWQLSLVSVLFISSIPHLTLHPLHFFKMFLYLFTVFFLKQECMCVCVHACICVYVSSSKFKL